MIILLSIIAGIVWGIFTVNTHDRNYLLNEKLHKEEMQYMRWEKEKRKHFNKS